MPEPEDKPEPPTQDRPNVGGKGSGETIRDRAEKRPTKPLSPEASGGAGAKRKWPGDS